MCAQLPLSKNTYNTLKKQIASDNRTFINCTRSNCLYSK